MNLRDQAIQRAAKQAGMRLGRSAVGAVHRYLRERYEPGADHDPAIVGLLAGTLAVLLTEVRNLPTNLKGEVVEGLVELIGDHPLVPPRGSSALTLVPAPEDEEEDGNGAA